MKTMASSVFKKKKAWNFFVYALLISICSIWLLPFVYLIFQRIQRNGQLYTAKRVVFGKF